MVNKINMFAFDGKNKEFSDNLLNFIEECGMLPPEKIHKFPCNDSVIYDYSNEWDKDE